MVIEIDIDLLYLSVKQGILTDHAGLIPVYHPIKLKKMLMNLIEFLAEIIIVYACLVATFNFSKACITLFKTK